MEPDGYGRRESVLVGTLALGLIYGLLAPLHVLVLDGAPRLVMTTLAVASLLLCVAVRRRVRRAGATDASFHLLDRSLLVMCALPLANSLTHLAVTAQLEQTTVIMLSVVGVAAVNPHRRQVVPLLAAAFVTWGALVSVVRPEPQAQTLHYVIQMSLSTALALAVFVIRSRVVSRLDSARSALTLQLEESERLKDVAEVNHQHFRDVFEDSPAGIALADERGVFVEVNAALSAFLGRPPEEIVGRTSADFTHPDDLAYGDPDRVLRTSSEEVARLEKRYVRPDGEVRWGWLTMRAVPGPAGERHRLAHVLDVTERKADEEKLRQSGEAMRAVAAIASASQQDADTRSVALTALTSLTSARAVALLEPTSERALTVTAHAGDASLVGTVVSLDERSATAHVWATGEPLFVSRAHEHPLVNQRLLRLTTAGSMLWEPVVGEQDVRAVITVLWDECEARVSDVERQAVGMIAAELATALRAEDLRARLEAATVTDPLTGLLNRRGWEQRLTALTAHAERSGRPITVALVDLDHFKRYNDTHGHARGDRALARFAAQAGSSLRAVDAIARWGGEEFAVALSDTDARGAADALERLRAAAPDGLTCSIGYSELRPDEPVESAMLAADRALYAAKEAGRNRIRHAGPPDATAAAG